MTTTAKILDFSDQKRSLTFWQISVKHGIVATNKYRYYGLQACRTILQRKSAERCYRQYTFNTPHCHTVRHKHYTDEQYEPIRKVHTCVVYIISYQASLKAKWFNNVHVKYKTLLLSITLIQSTVKLLSPKFRAPTDSLT